MLTQNLNFFCKCGSAFLMTPKIKLFSWQLIRKRIRTRDQVYTNALIDKSCPFCHSEVENIDRPFIYELLLF